MDLALGQDDIAERPLERSVWRDVATAFAMSGDYFAADRLRGVLLALGVGGGVLIESLSGAAATVAMGTIISMAASRNGDAAMQALLAFGAATLSVQFGTILQMAAQSVMGMRWRRAMTIDRLHHWLDDRRYYRLRFGRGVDNPEQRIEMDLDTILGQFLGLFVTMCTMLISAVAYAGLLWSVPQGGLRLFGIDLVVPGLYLWLAIAVGVLCTVGSHFASRALVRLGSARERTEADFRAAMYTIRRSSLSLAFQRGEGAVLDGLVDRIAAIRRIWIAFTLVSMRHMVVSVFLTSLSTLVPLLSAGSIIAARGQAGQLSVTRTAFGGVAAPFSFIGSMYTLFAELRASVSRIRQFDEALREPVTGDIAVAEADDDAIRVTDLTLAYPDGATMLRVGDFAIRPGERILLRGASGSGKSSFLRALGGLWHHGSGAVSLPRGARMTFVPQQPYLAEGPLGDLLIPGGDAPVPDAAAMAALLDRLDLAPLATRLDESADWSRILSPGEQQRIAAARAILARPDFLLLDEATSALDPDLEQRLYAETLRALPDAAILSIAHRPDVARFHQRVVTVGLSPDQRVSHAEQPTDLVERDRCPLHDRVRRQSGVFVHRRSEQPCVLARGRDQLGLRPQLASSDRDPVRYAGFDFGQRGLLDRLSCGPFRPPSQRRIRDVVLSANLVESNIRERELLREMGHGL